MEWLNFLNMLYVSPGMSTRRSRWIRQTSSFQNPALQINHYTIKTTVIRDRNTWKDWQAESVLNYVWLIKEYDNILKVCYFFYELKAVTETSVIFQTLINSDLSGKMAEYH